MDNNNEHTQETLEFSANMGNSTEGSELAENLLAKSCSVLWWLQVTKLSHFADRRGATGVAWQLLFVRSMC